ncbi:MAG: hypothetical protein DU480_13680 [Nitrosomonas sp.]|uniref:hypothetical protein n=1 Tax=Nitrosomonas sp. TaxID=42353 RepID=UPI0032EFBAE0
MLWLTEDAILVCSHETGIVINTTTQNFVRINRRRVLVENNPENRGIVGCPNIGVGIKPCTTTLKVKQGYSGFIRINGHRVCLSTVTGLTDGTPPGVVTYKVRNSGQNLIRES